MLIRLLHFLSGYVVFTAVGGFPERFVNLCAGMRIPVWDICPCGNTLRGKTKPKAFLRLRHAARRAGMHLHITGKCGLPFFLRRHKDRIGVPIGAAVFLLLLTVLSAHIWVIDIEGTDQLTADTVRAALRTLHVEEGMRSGALHASDTERALVQTLPQLHWVALNADGSVLHVEVRESENAETTEPSPCHIVAARDGFLERIETYDGQQIVQAPTAVQKGELLISGAKEHLHGTTLHHASGYAEAITTRTLVCRLTARAYSSPVRKRFRVALRLFGMHLPLGSPYPADGAQFFAYETFADASGIRLPLSYVVYRSTFYDGPNRLNDERCRLLLQSDFGQTAAMQLRGAQILQAQVHIRNDTCIGTFTLRENIAAEQEILLE